MERKGIFLKLPTDDIDTINKIIKHNKRLNKTQIIRAFLEGLHGMGSKCGVLIYDEHHVNLITQDFKVVSLDREYLSFDVQLQFQDGNVTTDGICVNTLKGGLK